jgi:hypothetical protein
MVDQLTFLSKLIRQEEELFQEASKKVVGVEVDQCQGLKGCSTRNHQCESSYSHMNAIKKKQESRPLAS